MVPRRSGLRLGNGRIWALLLPRPRSGELKSVAGFADAGDVNGFCVACVRRLGVVSVRDGGLRFRRLSGSYWEAYVGLGLTWKPRFITMCGVYVSTSVVVVPESVYLVVVGVLVRGGV